MRVLFLASFFPKPGNPLMGTWALGQARALKQHDFDIEVVSFTSWVPTALALRPGAKAYAHCPDRHDWDGLTTHYPRWLYYPVGPLKRWAYRNPHRQARLAWRSARHWLFDYVHRFKPDVVLAHHTMPNGFLAMQLKRRLGLPYVTSDYDFGEIASCRTYPQRNALYSAVAGEAFRSVAAARRMEREMRELFPSARPMTLHQAADDPPADLVRIPRPEAIRGRTVIFAAAMFAERKGVPLLIQAFAKVASRHPDAILRIAGDGPDREAVTRTAATSGLGQRIQLLGRIDHAQVLQEMAWSDAFALVGWDEPFATVYLEAMSLAKPIVCCSDGGITDVVNNGIQGLVVPPRDVEATANALDQLLNNPERRIEMGKAGRRLIEDNLNWSSIAQSWHDVLSKAAATRSTSL